MKSKSDSIINLLGALLDAKKEMGVVHESQKMHSGPGFAYADLIDYLDVIDPALEKHGLCVVTSNPMATPLEDRKTKGDGIEHPIQVVLEMELLHVSGEHYQIEVRGQAQDTGDRAVSHAITSARKSGYACLFGLTTSKDPARMGKKPKTQAEPQATPPQTKPRTDHPEIESSKSDPQKAIKIEIHDKLEEMYGKDYAVKGTLERITEWEKDGKPMPGIKSLREKISKARLDVIQNKVGVEYKAFQDLKPKETENELPL